MPYALARLQEARVTFFESTPMAYLVYAGSCTWVAVLVAFDATLLVSGDWPRLDSLLPTLIGVNALALGVQTIDVLFFHMQLWPLVALLWTCQLYALLLAASALGYALARDTPSDEVPTRHAILFLRGAAQCVFTASQFAVTLEYLHRSVRTPNAATTTVVRAPRVQLQR
jgi:hypothetical protein